MRESMARLTPRFSAGRAVCDYTEQHYLPAADDYKARTSDKGEAGSRLNEWRHSLQWKWAGLRFGRVQVTTGAGKHTVEVEVYLNGLDSSSLAVQLCAEGLDSEAPARVEMQRTRQRAAVDDTYSYSASVPAVRPAGDYTARVIPRHTGVAIPLEYTQILWQR